MTKDINVGDLIRSKNCEPYNRIGYIIKIFQETFKVKWISVSSIDEYTYVLNCEWFHRNYHIIKCHKLNT